MSGSNYPRFTEAYGQWDLSASYDFRDNYTFYLEGINVTGETTREHTRQHNMLLQAVQTGPRWGLGFRAGF
jgi:iron complex outermembrane receptor protein